MMQEIGGESFKVCYSGHSSLNEIKEFLRYFQPSDISPIVLPRLVIWFYCFLNNNKRKKNITLQFSETQAKMKS